MSFWLACKSQLKCFLELEWLACVHDHDTFDTSISSFTACCMYTISTVGLAQVSEVIHIVCAQVTINIYINCFPPYFRPYESHSRPQHLTSHLHIEHTPEYSSNNTTVPLQLLSWLTTQQRNAHFPKRSPSRIFYVLLILRRTLPIHTNRVSTQSQATKFLKAFKLCSMAPKKKLYLLEQIEMGSCLQQ